MGEVVEIRVLTPSDALVLKRLRLRALKDAPEAFGASYEDELQQPDAHFLQLIGEGPNAVFGAWSQDVLIGKAGFVVETGRKSRHKGYMWGVYVVPDRRGEGIAQRLVKTVIAHAGRHVEALKSGVVAANAEACGLYLKLGFSIYGVEPRALKIDGRYFDENLIIYPFV